MREKKSNKFKRGQGRKKSVALKKDDISWLSKNTHFDPDTVTEWHKVRKVYPRIELDALITSLDLNLLYDFH